MSFEPDSDHSDLAPSAPAGSVQEKPRYPWRLFLLLAAMMLVASVLVVPYSIQLASIGDPEIANQAPIVVLSSIIQAVLLYLPMLLVGLLVAGRLGLGAPFLQAAVYRLPVPPGLRRGLISSAVIGLGAGLLLLVLAGLFSGALPTELTSLSPAQLPNAFQGFMASISAGINEEILLRLFLLSLIAWLIQLVVKRSSAGRPAAAILWTANGLAAVIFGLLHLPNLLAVNAPITLMVVVYVILLNGVAGLGFGWLYWTFGIEVAMLAHFLTDIVLHVIIPLFS